MPAYSFKKRFVPNIRAGLGLIGIMVGDVEIPCEFVVDAGSTVARPFDPMLDLDPPVRPKRQTIRAEGKRRHARPGETIQLYTAMRTKQCRKIGDARCTSVSEIVIAFSRSSPNTNTMISIDGAARYTGAALDDFARLDGFQDWNDMLIFWQDEHGISKPFRGLLIEWEPMP